MAKKKKIVWNVDYLNKEGEVIDSTQIDEKSEELAKELFVEFGHNLENLAEIEWEETTEED